MKIYKKVIPYMLAGCAMLTGCSRTDFHDVVVGKEFGLVFLDRNGDGARDVHIRYSQHDINIDMFYDYMQPGDTLEYSVQNRDLKDQWLERHRVHIKRVNGYDDVDIRVIKAKNEYRDRMKQPRTRTL